MSKLSDFSEGQWWVKELDSLKIGETVTVTLDIYRAVQVVHNLLRAVREAEATKTFHTYGMPWQGGQQASGFTSGGPPAWPAGRQFGECPSCGRSDCVALACARLMPLHGNVILNAREIAKQTGLPLHKDEKGDEYISLKDTEPEETYLLRAQSSAEILQICDGIDDSMPATDISGLTEAETEATPPVGYVSGVQTNEKVSLNFHDVASATAWFERFMDEYESTMLNRKDDHERRN